MEGSASLLPVGQLSAHGHKLRHGAEDLKVLDGVTVETVPSLIIAPVSPKAVIDEAAHRKAKQPRSFQWKASNVCNRRTHIHFPWGDHETGPIDHPGDIFSLGHDVEGMEISMAYRNRQGASWSFRFQPGDSAPQIGQSRPLGQHTHLGELAFEARQAGVEAGGSQRSNPRCYRQFMQAE